jgi:hypothetical protein
MTQKSNTKLEATTHEEERNPVVVSGWLQRREKRSWMSRWVELDGDGKLTCFDKGIHHTNMVATPYKKRLECYDLLYVVQSDIDNTKLPKKPSARTPYDLHLDVRALTDQDDNAQVHTMSFRTTDRGVLEQFALTTHNLVKNREEWLTNIKDTIDSLKNERNARQAHNYLVLKSELTKKIGRELTVNERSSVTAVLRQHFAVKP